MPFLDRIATFINDSLKAGSLNKKQLNPAQYLGLTTTIGRKKNAAQQDVEVLPAVISVGGKATPISPDSKLAIQLYHKLQTNVYSYVKKSYGDGYDIKSVSELSLVVISNSKLTGVAKYALEPVVLFGLPQRLSGPLATELQINSCLITPLGSNMDHMQVFRSEYPKSEYFLNEQMSMFLIRYRIEMTFSQACVDQCLCN